jgi:ribosomal protein S18 acetylase RimI-like enzyme
MVSRRLTHGVNKPLQERKMSPLRNIKSLGLKSDLMIASHKSAIEDCNDYIVVKSAHNPSDCWGNFLLFKHPPAMLDAQLCNARSWEYLFHREFADEPGVGHVAFAWDSPEGIPGDSEEFIALGFSLNESRVFSTSDIYPPVYGNQDIRISEINKVDQWRSVLDLLMLVRDPGHEENAYRRYIERKVEHYRSLAMKKAGAWFGAFVGEHMVGTLGMFMGEGVGRFQHVVTHPAYRRRGVCSTLMYEIGSLALTMDDVQELVVVASANDDASRIYHSLGFKHAETLFSLEKSSLMTDDDLDVTQKMPVITQRMPAFSSI